MVRVIGLAENSGYQLKRDSEFKDQIFLLGMMREEKADCNSTPFSSICNFTP